MRLNTFYESYLSAQILNTKHKDAYYQLNIFAATSNQEFMKSMLSNPQTSKNLSMAPSIHTPIDDAPTKKDEQDSRLLNEIPGANYAIDEIAYKYLPKFSNRKRIEYIRDQGRTGTCWA